MTARSLDVIPDADRLPTLDVTAALAYVVGIGFPDFTERSLVNAMAHGALAYKIIAKRRHTSRAALRRWLLSGMDESE